jgi:peptidoglycan/LPS O-acetylase OafA/YrhL
MQASNKNIHSLHIIRGLAALVVVVYHAKFILWAGGSLWKQNVDFHSFADYILFGIDMLSSCGEQCVLVFFLLSGFVIYHSFQHSDRSLKHFFIIRGLRIYIPYLVSLCISLLVLYYAVQLNNGIAVNGVKEYNTRLLSAYNEIGFANILRTIFFIKGNEYAGFNFVYWSLLHEVIFYIVFPLYFYAGKRYRALLMLVHLVAYLITKSNFFYFQLFFLCGMFLYDYYATGRELFLKNSRLYLPLIILLYCITNLLTKLPWQHFANISALILAALAFDYLLTGKYPGKFFKGLADMSFSLYLNHLWVLLLCYCIAFRYFGTLVIYQRYPYYLSIAIALPVCWWLYVLVEKRSLVLISKVKARWRNKEFKK